MLFRFLKFKHWIHLEFIWVYVVKLGFKFFFLPNSQFPQHHLLTKSIPHWESWLYSSRIKFFYTLGCICFWIAIFSINLFVVSSINTALFKINNFVVDFVWLGMIFLIFSFKIFLNYFHFLFFYINLKWILLNKIISLGF